MSSETQTTAAFPTLANQNFMSLKTFRKSGKEVPTPVWFAQAGEKLYVTTSGNSGKVKRIRNSGAVEVAPCDVRGNLLGEPYVSAHAEIIADQTERDTAHKLLQKKYGLQYRAIAFMSIFRRNYEPVFLVITPA